MGIKKQWARALEIPLDLACKEPLFTLTGQSRAVIENYRTLLEYTDERILVSTVKGRLLICGKKLYIPCYTPVELEIEGRIEKVVLEAGQKYL